MQYFANNYALYFLFTSNYFVQCSIQANLVPARSLHLPSNYIVHCLWPNELQVNIEETLV